MWEADSRWSKSGTWKNKRTVYIATADVDAVETALCRCDGLRADSVHLHRVVVTQVCRLVMCCDTPRLRVEAVAKTYTNVCTFNVYERLHKLNHQHYSAWV